jgi:predicted DNA-binding protein YlxM (UPF0122 family)
LRHCAPSLGEPLSVTDRPTTFALPESVVNPTLDDAIELCRAELERLKVKLEVYRRLKHRRREQLLKVIIARIDERQTALDQLEALVVARRDPEEPIH